MTAIHEQLVRDHVGQLLRDARRARRINLASRAGRRHPLRPAQHPAGTRNAAGTRPLRRCEHAAARRA